MKYTGIFYGSSTGNTEFAAQRIAAELGISNSDVYDVSADCVSKLKDYKNLIFGFSTWGPGEVQDDFSDFLDYVSELDFSGKTIALFALGDQVISENSFVDSLGRVYDFFQTKNCKIIGNWPVDGYVFKQSKGVIGNSFVGLALDEDNQSNLTDSRIKSWVSIIKTDL